MGTNYYLKDFKENTSLHIGKSSFGWCFALRQYAQRGLLDLPDWEKKFNSTYFSAWCQIFDEYDQPIDVETFLIVVRNRSRSYRPVSDKFLNDNFAELGPNNLLRAKLKGSEFDTGSEHGAVAYGEGTWDLFEDEFS